MSVAQRTKDMRRFDRQEVCFHCELAGADIEPTGALLVNISPLGGMLRCSREMKQGSAVYFTLPLAGRVDAHVVWAIGGRIGLEFTQEIDAAPYLAMLEQLRRPGDEMSIY